MEQRFSKVAFRQRQSLCLILFCSFCSCCLPAGRQHAQKLQKIFPVAAGDHAQEPACSAESNFCAALLGCPAPPHLYSLLNYGIFTVLRSKTYFCPHSS